MQEDVYSLRSFITTLTYPPFYKTVLCLLWLPFIRRIHTGYSFAEVVQLLINLKRIMMADFHSASFEKQCFGFSFTAIILINFSV